MPSTRVITISPTEPVQVVPSKEIKPAIDVFVGLGKEAEEAQRRSALVTRTAAAAEQTFRNAEAVGSANLPQLELAFQEAEKELQDARQAEALVQARAEESRELLARAVAKDFSKSIEAIKNEGAAISAGGSGDKPPHDDSNKGHTQDPADEPTQGTPAADHFGAFLAATAGALYRAQGELLRVAQVLVRAERDAAMVIIKTSPPTFTGSAQLQGLAQQTTARIEAHRDQVARLAQNSRDLCDAARNILDQIDNFLDNDYDPVQNYDEAFEITEYLHDWGWVLEQMPLVVGAEGAMLLALAQHLQRPGLDRGVALFELSQIPFLRAWLL
jgi:hypothetical protein